jgi:hypothetical protein
VTARTALGAIASVIGLAWSASAQEIRLVNGQPELLLSPAMARAVEDFAPGFRPFPVTAYPEYLWHPCQPMPACKRSQYRVTARQAPFAVVAQRLSRVGDSWRVGA